MRKFFQPGRLCLKMAAACSRVDHEPFLKAKLRSLDTNADDVACETCLLNCHMSGISARGLEVQLEGLWWCCAVEFGPLPATTQSV